MNDYEEGRKRGRSLLVVEGEHEKDRLFWLILRCFPEIEIDEGNIWVYHTNIYILYDDIVREYGEDWFEYREDIDLPFVISKKQETENVCYKSDFTNIVLVFDYERHDPNFTEAKIMSMQQTFTDSTDMGMLYINYPMIESYQHLKNLPDSEYINRTVSASINAGAIYKNTVKKNSVIAPMVDYPHRLEDLLSNRFVIDNPVIRMKCCERILTLNSVGDIETEVECIINNIMDSKKALTAKYQLIDWIHKQHYAEHGLTYWQYMRNVLRKIAVYNILKADYIQHKTQNTDEDDNSYRRHYENIDFLNILTIQNELSRDRQNGYIWVLNTCIMYIAEYNFRLIEQEKGDNQ